MTLLMLLALLLALLSFPAYKRQILFGALLGTLFLYQRQVTDFSSVPNTGIAQSEVELNTYSIVLLLALVFFASVKGERRVRWVFIPFCVFVFVWSVGFWTVDGRTLAGIVQLLLGVVAFVLAFKFRSLVDTRFYAIVIWCVAVTELAVAVLQRLGLEIFSMDSYTAALMDDRVNGTFNHPNNLAKAMFLLLVLATPLLQSSDTVVRWLARVAIFAAFVTSALTEGRAALVAAASLILAVTVLRAVFRSGSQGLQVGVPIVMGALSIPFVSTIASRFETDTEGGARPHLRAVALDAIASNPLIGTGPNNYVHVIGRHDSVTAMGFPVHDGFLLLAAELGLLGAVLYLFPVVYSLMLAWRSRRQEGRGGESAIVLISAAPGFCVIFMTGWGMLSGSLLPLSLFVIGLLASQFITIREPDIGSARTGSVLPLAGGRRPSEW